MDIEEVKGRENIKARDLNRSIVYEKVMISKIAKEHVRTSLHALLEYCLN